MWCCVKYAIRQRLFIVERPIDAWIAPVKSLMSVDLPAPFGPMTAMRLSRSTLMLTPLRMILSGE